MCQNICFGLNFVCPLAGMGYIQPFFFSVSLFNCRSSPFNLIQPASDSARWGNSNDPLARGVIPLSCLLFADWSVDKRENCQLAMRR